MAIDWSILAQTPNIGGALQTGVQQGRALRAKHIEEGALAAYAANPTDEQPVNDLLRVNAPLALKLREEQRDTRRRGALAAVFAPTAAQPTGGVLSGAASPGSPALGALSMPPQAGSPEPTGSMPAADQPPVSRAPTTLIDPVQLPARTDGLTVNKEALRHLYQEDYETAFKIQTMIFDADAKALKAAQANGAQMASVAWHLREIRLPDGTPDLEGRQQELAAMAPQLAQIGISPDMLVQADLSDRGLNRYITTGRAIGDLVKDDRADRRLEWDREDDEADNARADRDVDSRIGARQESTEQGWSRVGISRESMVRADARGRRGQDIGSSDRRRGQDLVDRRARDGVGGGSRRGGTPRVKTKADYEKLPAGSEYIAPNGARMRKAR